MRIKKIAPYFISVITAVIFGIICYQKPFPHQTLWEIGVLWYLPLLNVNIINRNRELTISRRFISILVMVVSIIIAEYIGIKFQAPSNEPILLQASELYRYRAIYLIIGPIQLFLFGLLSLIINSTRLSKWSRAVTVFLLLTIICWLFSSPFADYRPGIESPQLELIIFMYLIMAGLIFGLLRLVVNRSISMNATVLISIGFLLPVMYLV